MKKLIYLVLSVLCAISGIYGIYDTITTPQDDLTTSIIAILLLASLAWLFMHLFLKPEPRHKHQAANMPEPFALGFPDRCYSAVFPVFPTVPAWFAYHCKSLQITAITGKAWAKCGHGWALLTRPSAG